MRWRVVVGGLVLGWAVAGWADTVSYTGTLASPEDSFTTTVNVDASGAVTLQTYGFGGGVNAAGTTIAAGGFDPFVALFAGTGDGAVFVDGTSDIFGNVTGCPPAGTVAIGDVPDQCGDVNLQFTDLAAGTYTVLLTDGAYLPYAVFEGPGGLLGDGFFDLTGGVFQTCYAYDPTQCNDDTANWALDVTTSGSSSTPPVPEPASVELAGMGVVLVAAWMYRRQGQESKEVEINEVKGRA